MTRRQPCPDPRIWSTGDAEGSLEPRLAEHLAACANCRREHRLASLFGELATVTPPPLPDPSTLRWRARILEDLAQREQVAERRALPTLPGLAVGWTLVVIGLSAIAWGVFTAGTLEDAAVLAPIALWGTVGAAAVAAVATPLAALWATDPR